MMIEFLMVFIGSALGGMLRYAITLLQTYWSAPFQWTTLLVNILGGLVIGSLTCYFLNRESTDLWKLLLITGFCGGLTTFSTFSLEVFQYLHQQEYKMAIMLSLLHLTLSISATFIGWIFTKTFLS